MRGSSSKDYLHRLYTPPWNTSLATLLIVQTSGCCNCNAHPVLCYLAICVNFNSNQVEFSLFTLPACSYNVITPDKIVTIYWTPPFGKKKTNPRQRWFQQTWAVKGWEGWWGVEGSVDRGGSSQSLGSKGVGGMVGSGGERGQRWFQPISGQ